MLMIDPPPAFLHIRQDCAGKQPQSANVQSKGLVPLIFADLLGGADVEDSGVVEQDVHPAKSR